jgi:hypothetical protein
MLIAALITYLLIHYDSSSPALLWPYEQTEKRIKQDVTDGARQKQALEIVEQMKTVNKAYAKQRERSVEALAKLEAMRETPVAQLERAGQPLIAEDRATAEQLLVLRFQLKSVLTASEWAKVIPAPATTAATARKSALAAQ